MPQPLKDASTRVHPLAPACRTRPASGFGRHRRHLRVRRRYVRAEARRRGDGAHSEAWPALSSEWRSPRRRQTQHLRASTRTLLLVARNGSTPLFKRADPLHTPAQANCWESLGRPSQCSCESRNPGPSSTTADSVRHSWAPASAGALAKFRIRNAGPPIHPITPDPFRGLRRGEEKGLSLMPFPCGPVDPGTGPG